MAFNSEDMIKVTNRSGISVSYRIPEDRIYRDFNARETKVVPYKEIQAVSQQPGGRELIYNYLLIENAEVLHQATNIQEEQEYWLTEDKIPHWMNSCTLDEFKDALDFAPDGVKLLIKDYAISLPLNDVEKRNAIKEILKFDVTAALDKLASVDEEPVQAEVKTSKRRAPAAPVYKVSEQK